MDVVPQFHSFWQFELHENWEEKRLAVFELREKLLEARAGQARLKKLKQWKQLRCNISWCEKLVRNIIVQTLKMDEEEDIFNAAC
jgi:hypothetical protein